LPFLKFQACLPAIVLTIELGCKVGTKLTDAVEKAFVWNMRAEQKAKPLGISGILQGRRDLGLEPGCFSTMSCLLR